MRNSSLTTLAHVDTHTLIHANAIALNEKVCWGAWGWNKNKDITRVKRGALQASLSINAHPAIGDGLDALVTIVKHIDNNSDYTPLHTENIAFIVWRTFIEKTTKKTWEDSINAAMDAAVEQHLISDTEKIGLEKSALSLVNMIKKCNVWTTAYYMATTPLDENLHNIQKEVQEGFNVQLQRQASSTSGLDEDLERRLSQLKRGF